MSYFDLSSFLSKRWNRITRLKRNDHTSVMHCMSQHRSHSSTPSRESNPNSSTTPFPSCQRLATSVFRSFSFTPSGNAKEKVLFLLLWDFVFLCCFTLTYFFFWGGLTHFLLTSVEEDSFSVNLLIRQRCTYKKTRSVGLFDRSTLKVPIQLHPL